MSPKGPQQATASAGASLFHTGRREEGARDKKPKLAKMFLRRHGVWLYSVSKLEVPSTLPKNQLGPVRNGSVSVTKISFVQDNIILGEE